MTYPSGGFQRARHMFATTASSPGWRHRERGGVRRRGVKHHFIATTFPRVCHAILQSTPGRDSATAVCVHTNNYLRSRGKTSRPRAYGASPPILIAPGGSPGVYGGTATTKEYSLHAGCASHPTLPPPPTPCSPPLPRPPGTLLRFLWLRTDVPVTHAGTRHSPLFEPASTKDAPDACVPLPCCCILYRVSGSTAPSILTSALL